MIADCAVRFLNTKRQKSLAIQQLITMLLRAVQTCWGQLGRCKRVCSRLCVWLDTVTWQMPGECVIMEFTEMVNSCVSDELRNSLAYCCGRTDWTRIHPELKRVLCKWAWIRIFEYNLVVCWSRNPSLVGNPHIHHRLGAQILGTPPSGSQKFRGLRLIFSV